MQEVSAFRLNHPLPADDGVLFLDEIGELGDDEQVMLLRALEEKAIPAAGGRQGQPKRLPTDMWNEPGSEARGGYHYSPVTPTVGVTVEG
jgi:hypothetical protein